MILFEIPSNRANTLVMSKIKHMKKLNLVFGLRSSRKSINLKNLQGNSAAPMIPFPDNFAINKQLAGSMRT